MQPDKEAVTRIVELMHSTLAEQLQSDADWALHLRFIGRLHGYSPYNRLLLWAQWEQRREWRRIMRGLQAAMFGAPIFDELPPMRYCASFSTWRSMGGHVIKGEKALSVLAPVLVKDYDDLDENGKPREKCVRYVGKNRTFEVSQVDGIEAPEPVQLLDGERPERLWECLIDLAEHLGYTVTVGDSGDANGYCDHAGRRIVVAERNSGLQQTKTLAHEIAHAMLHDPESRPKFMSQVVAEVEAESVAYAVMVMAGLDSSDYSFGYVGTWSGGDGALIAATLERVVDCATRIATCIETGTLPAARRLVTKFDFAEQ
jgi:hypothetical protein